MAEQIGRYNRKIEIWNRAGTLDAAGEPVANNWVLYKSKWAMIRGRNGMSLVRESGSASSGKEAEAPLDMQSFRVAFCTDITADMQIRWLGTQYDIIMIRPDLADRQFTDIIVRTGASSG